MIGIIVGKVIHGKGKGRTFGIPTFNLQYDDNLKIEKGVYVSTVNVDEKKYIGVTNIGLRPTVDDSDKVTIETHLIDYDGDLYNKEVELYIYEKIRDTKKFNSIEDLKKQINNDIMVVRERSNKYV